MVFKESKLPAKPFDCNILNFILLFLSLRHGLLPDKAIPELVKSESRIIVDGNAQDESDSDD